MQVAVAEDKTAGGVLLTDSAKEKPVIGTVWNFYSSGYCLLCFKATRISTLGL